MGTARNAPGMQSRPRSKPTVCPLISPSPDGEVGAVKISLDWREVWKNPHQGFSGSTGSAPKGALESCLWNFARLTSFDKFAASMKKAETLFRLICCEKKTLFRLKKQAEKDGL